MKKASLAFYAALMIALTAPRSHAVTVDEVLTDPTLEARARKLSAGLRCMVCQNQSIDDSDAPLAKDLRGLVRERLAAGDSDDEARAFLVARYGDFILLQPPLRSQTVLLWLTPPLVVAFSGFAWTMAYRRRRRFTQAPTALSEEELAELKSATERRD